MTIIAVHPGNQEGHKKAFLLRYNQLICCTKFSLLSMQCLDLKWISCQSKKCHKQRILIINLSPAQITLRFPYRNERLLFTGHNKLNLKRNVTYG